jgi:hypothetical protein
MLLNVDSDARFNHFSFLATPKKFAHCSFKRAGSSKFNKCPDLRKTDKPDVGIVLLSYKLTPKQASSALPIIKKVGIFDAANSDTNSCNTEHIT